MHLLKLQREQEALVNCQMNHPKSLPKLHRIVGDKLYLNKNYKQAIEHYFNSELNFEQILRLLYRLYRENKQTEFALQMLFYLSKTLMFLKESQETLNRTLKLTVLSTFLIEICSYNANKLRILEQRLCNLDPEHSELKETRENLKLFATSLDFFLDKCKEHVEEHIVRQILESHSCFEAANMFARRCQNLVYNVHYYMGQQQFGRAIKYLRDILNLLLSKRIFLGNQMDINGYKCI